MRVPPAYLRFSTGLAVLAVVLVVFFVGGPGDEASTPAPEPTPTSTPTATPSVVSTEAFCAAFDAMAAAHSNHLANNTDESLAELTAAAETVLRLEPGTAMPPAARQGLRELVDGVLGTSSAAPDEKAADELAAFLDASCTPAF